MRRRLLLSTLLVAVSSVLLLGVPLAVVGARAERENVHQRLERDAVAVSVSVEDRIEHHEPVDPGRLEHLLRSQTAATVSTPDGATVHVGPRLSGALITATAPVGERGRVVVATQARRVDARVLSAELLVLGLAALAVLVAVGLALLQGRRFAGPLVDLAATAERFGSGDIRPQRRRYRIPELDRVVEVLDASGRRLAELLRRERAFAADASHQLRTPLTALSIRLDEIADSAADPEFVREEAQAALAQVERLTEVVDSLLVRARQSRAETARTVDVAALLHEQEREWRPAYRRADRQLVVDASGPAWALATPGGLGQAVATLLDNALVHGAGTVVARLRQTGPHVVIEVTDEGAGVPGHLVPFVFERDVSGRGGTGLGLALARALVEADGGRLELARGTPPLFAVFLTTADAPETPAPRRARSVSG